MKNFYRLILAIGLLTVLTSSFALPPCQGSDYSKWNNCFGDRIYENGDKYSGDWQGGKRRGQGTFFWLGDTKWKGDMYVGAWLDNLRTGQGTYTFADGNVYVGEVVENIHTGQATFFWKDGSKYVGEFKDFKLNGLGIYYRTNGSISQAGIWKDGTLLTSQYVDPNSFTRIAKGNTSPSTAEAQRIENERKAAQLEEERRKFEEEKRQAALERQRIESQKGQTLPQCQGSETYKWNNCYGSWTASDGGQYAGEWKDGTFNGQGAFIWTSGDKVAGEFKSGKTNGLVVRYFPDGNRYEGEEKDGLKHGQGILYFLDDNKWKGQRYVGEYQGDNRNGLGIFYRADGGILESGLYKDNTLVKSQYVDPKSFTRISKGNSAPAGADALRLENERKAAQLDEDRKRMEEEKRQVALERQRIESQKTQTQIAPDNRRRLALVIGNDNYSSMPVLNNAVNDSKSMNDALKQANFEVLYYKNLNKRGMEEALYTFAQKLGKDDVGMFYFAGHGVQANGKNFLIPVAENVKKSADVQFEGIDVNRVMAYLQDSKNSLNIVVLDACRSGLPERGGMSRGLTVTEAPQGSIVAYATSPGKAASDGDGGNSPFTKNLIRVMQRKGVKIEDVFKEVRVAVARETNGEQVPQEVSQLVGDFYFRP